jgi:hypothetical protein
MVLDGKLKSLVTEESTYKASSLFKLMIQVLFEVNGVTSNAGEGSFRQSSNHFSAATYDVLINYISAAVSYLQSLRDLTVSLRSAGSTVNQKRTSSVDDTIVTIKKFFGDLADVTFLQSVCWNSAIDCNNSTNFNQAARFFHLQFELGKHLPLSKSNSASQQTLLLLSAACKLHYLSDESRLVSSGVDGGVNGGASTACASMVIEDVKSYRGDDNGNVTVLGKHILDLLSQAKLEGEKSRDLPSTSASSIENFSPTPSASTPFVHTPELALKISNIIEFEVLVQLRTDPNDLISKVSSYALLPSCDSDFFFELANAPNLPPAVEYSVLEVCYKLSLRNQVVDYNKLGQIIKRLSITAETRQISFSWFEQAWQIESARSKSMSSTCNGGTKFSPEIMEWFTTQCWNFGVFYSRLSLYEQAEKFLALALQLLPYAPVLRTTFGEDLDVAYSKLLSLLKKSEPIVSDE